MAYNYTIKFNGDISNIESLLSKKLSKEIQKVEENKITFTFDYKNGIDNLQDKLNEISKMLDPTIGVQFKYEVNKKLLEEVKADLQKEINDGFGDTKNAEHLRNVIDEITSKMKELQNLGANPDYISNVSTEAQKAQEKIESLEKSVKDLNDKLSQSISIEEFDELKKQIDEANQKINELINENDELQNELKGKGNYTFSYYSDFVNAQQQAEELRNEVARLNEELLIASSGGGENGSGTLGFNVSAINRIVAAVEKISNAIGDIPEEGQNLLHFIQEVNESLKEVYANVEEISLTGTNVHIDMGDSQSKETKQYLRKQFKIYKESYEKFFSGKFINPTDVFSAIANDKKYGEIFGYDVGKVKSRFGIDEITSLKDTETQVKRIIEFFNTIDSVIKSRKKTPGYDKNFEFNKELNLANSRAKRVVKERDITAIDEEMKAIENGVGKDILSKLNGEVQEEISDDVKSLNDIVSKLEEIRVILERITSENGLGQVFDGVINKLEEFKKALTTINYDKISPITDEQGSTQKWYRGVNGVKSGSLSNADDGQTYWTTNIELAQEYAGELGKVYEAELKAKNVLELDANGKTSDEIELISTQEGKDAEESLIGSRNLLNKYKEDLAELYAQLKEVPLIDIMGQASKNNEIEVKKNQIRDLENEIEILESKVEDSIILGTHDISSWAQNNGYDGVIFNNVKTAVDDIEKLGSTMVVFSADQEAALKTITDSSDTSEEKDKIQTISQELEEVIKTIQSKTEQFELEKQVVNNVVEEERNKLYELITTLSEVQATIESVYKSFNDLSNIRLDSIGTFVESLKKSIENIDFGSGFLSQINQILSKGEELKNLSKSLETLSKNKDAAKTVKKKVQKTDDKENEKKQIKEVKKAYETLISTEERYQQLKNKAERSELSKSEVYTYTKISEQRKQAESIIAGTSEKIKKEVGLEEKHLNVIEQITKALQKQNEIEDQEKSNKLKEDLQSLIDKTNKLAINPKYIESFRNELKDAANKATDALSGTDDEILEMTSHLDSFTSNIPKDKLESSFTKLEKLGLDVANILNSNTAMSSKLRHEFELLAQEIQNALDSGHWNDLGGLQEFQQKLIRLQKIMKQAGQDGDSMWRRIGNRLADMNSKMIAQYLSWQDIIRYIRQISGEVIKLDTALTELRKVSDASNDRLQQSLQKSSETAKELGAEISDVINVTADWARLGYNVDEAEELARVTTLFKNVGDNMSAEDASSFMISTLKGFEMEANQAMDIADKFNEVANNFAIDTAGIGDALQRSAAAFNAANTDLNESIALITATNAVVQNPESVGKHNYADLYSNV